jgi:hypothetical protein
LTEYETYETSDKLYKSNSLASANLRTNVNLTTTTANSSNVSYLENKYLEVSAANTAAIDYYEISLDTFKNTLLSVDKDLVFGEILLMRIVWNQGTKIAWASDSATVPDHYTDGASPINSVGNFTVNGLTLYLAIEQNEEISKAVYSKMKSGMHVLIPAVVSGKTNITASSSQSLSTRLNSGHGRTLMRTYFAPFYTAESISTTYNHTNVANDKVVDLYTLVNNVRQQEYNVTCTANTDLDYMLMKKTLHGSVVLSKDIYKYNWFFSDNFDHVKSMDEEKNVDESNLICGLPLTEEIKYDVYMTTASTNGYNWYSFFVVSRILSISPDKITVQ